MGESDKKSPLEDLAARIVAVREQVRAMIDELPPAEDEVPEQEA